MNKLIYRLVDTTNKKKKEIDPFLDTVYPLRASRVINMHICGSTKKKKDTRPKPRHGLPCREFRVMKASSIVALKINYKPSNQKYV